MSYFGKEFKFDRQENFEDFVNSFSTVPDEIKKQLIADKPAIKIDKNGDTYTQTEIRLDGSVRSKNFKSGVEFEETLAPGVDSKTTVTVSGNTFTQVQKTNISTGITKREFSDKECVATFSSEGSDVVARRYYKA